MKHTVTAACVDGKKQTYYKDRGKTKKSYRTLPLFPAIEELLLKHLENTEKNRACAGEAYNEKFKDYVFVNSLGDLVNPSYITEHYKRLLEKNKLKRIRFHDLRHSCATLLRQQGVPMEDIQRWLGHSSIATTEKIYAHFEDPRHRNSAKLIQQKLNTAKK
jgi:integrase